MTSVRLRELKAVLEDFGLGVSSMLSVSNGRNTDAGVRSSTNNLMIMYLQSTKKLHGVNRKDFVNALRRSSHPSRFIIRKKNLDARFSIPMTAAAHISLTAITSTLTMTLCIG